MNIKKERAIVFSATGNMAFAVASVIYDLKRLNCTEKTDIIFLYDKISLRDKNALLKVAPIVFIKYCFPIKDKTRFHAGTFNYFTEMVYAKFECLKLLDDYKTVLFTDYDIVIQQSINDLFELANSFAIIISKGSTVRDQFSIDIPNFDMQGKGVTTSLFILNDQLPDYMSIYKWCYDRVIEYAPFLRFPEQGIFALALQYFNIEPLCLDANQYCVHPDNAHNFPSAKILHAYGGIKFWNGIYNQQWNENYREWQSLGGSACKKRANWPLFFRIKRKIKKMLFKIKG